MATIVLSYCPTMAALYGDLTMLGLRERRHTKRVEDSFVFIMNVSLVSSLDPRNSKISLQTCLNSTPQLSAFTFVAVFDCHLVPFIISVKRAF